MEVNMKRYFCEKSPNLKWNIGENIGKNFEDFVSDLIKMQLKNLHPQVKVIQTNQVGDGGKDIIVTAETDHLVILGQNFSSYDNKNIKIYFECKSTNDQILRYDKIAPSTSRVQFQNINYYVLVTNSEILPQSYWYIAEELASKEIKFKLIDSFLLGTSVASLGFKDVFDNPYKKSGSFDFYYEYQIEELAPQQTNKYNIYLLFRNYTNLEKHCILQLKTNVDWDISETNISFVIAPNGAIVKKVTVNQTHFDGIPDLLFNMQVNGTESTVMINGINGMQFFEPPFFGEDRKKIISKLEYDLKSSNQPNSIYFWGDAVGFVRKFYNKEYSEAVQFLLDGKCGTIIRAKPKEIERKPFEMPKAYWNMNRVKDYLCNVRGIDEEVIQAFADKKMIFESLDYHNAVFVGFDKNSVPRHANKRGILKGSTFKGNAEGSLDEFAFHWIGTNNKLFLFEAPIDMLSYICMNKENWKENNYAASCSVSDRVLFQCLKDYPNINEVFIGYDNDFYGQRAAKRTQNKLDNMDGYTTKIIVPSYKDWNEDYLNSDEDGSEINWVI